MKVLYLPLDERPCNYYYPQMMAESNRHIELTLPDAAYLSHKKQAGNYKKIREYLLDNVQNNDALILSLDMLIYGGLLASRLHQNTAEELEKRLKIVKEIKEKNPKIKIYAFESLMRCPKYSSSEEEPSYYQEYGREIFLHKYLSDKKARVGISDEEQKELDSISIPKEVLADYEQRRQRNLQINSSTLDYLQKGYLDFLVIPQDDSAPFGYTVIDQKYILNEVKQKELDDQVMVYPGADEVGLSLLARAYNKYNHRKPSIYPFYSSVLGPTIVPLYEDRPMYESLMSHILVTGAKVCDNVKEADLILAVNSPGKFMQESFEEHKDITYSAYRHLRAFCYQIADYIKQGKSVGVLDSAYANGGDDELISLLDKLNLFSKIKAYAGWNTNCNSTGTVLCQLELGEETVANNIYHLIEDGIYQPKVRQKVIKDVLPKLGVSYYVFKDKEKQVDDSIASELLSQYNTLNISKKYPIKEINVTTPWHRMFEIGMNIS